MGKHGGKVDARPQRIRLTLMALGIVIALGAWAYLVWMAIRIGVHARDGDGSAWLLGLPAVGAVACLFLALILITRAVESFRGGSRPRQPGRRIAGR